MVFLVSNAMCAQVTICVPAFRQAADHNAGGRALSMDELAFAYVKTNMRGNAAGAEVDDIAGLQIVVVHIVAVLQLSGGGTVDGVAKVGEYILHKAEQSKPEGSSPPYT